MNDTIKRRPSGSDNGVSRRYFLRVAGTVTLGIGVGGYAGVKEALPKIVKLADGRSGMPVSGGYLLVDVKKCQGCMSCMLACSLVNEGVENLSLSRIQVIQNSFEKWPDDLTIEQCRQCVDPACVNACPRGCLKSRCDDSAMSGEWSISINVSAAERVSRSAPIHPVDRSWCRTKSTAGI